MIYKDLMPTRDVTKKHLIEKKSKAAQAEIINFISTKIRQRIDTWGDITKIKENSGLGDGTINKMILKTGGIEKPTFLKVIQLMYGADIKIEDMRDILIKHGLCDKKIDYDELKRELIILLDAFKKDKPPIN